MKPGWGIAISLFLCCCLWESEAARWFNTIPPLFTTGEGIHWGYIHMCRTGFVNGYSLKITEHNALHGIRLQCVDNRAHLTSREARCGEWTPFTTCSEGHFLKGYRLRLSEDKSTMINIQFKCSDDSILNEIGPQGGEYTSWSGTCNRYMCGMKANVKPVGGNVSPLINMRFQCCIHK